MLRLQGITWEHKRAVRPLEALNLAFKKQRPDVEIKWNTRPLSGFEFDPIDHLAINNDLIIYDHPFCGRVHTTGCLINMDEILEMAGGSTSYVGPSMESYCYGGNSWAIPVDAACQVAAYRPDLLSNLDHEIPLTWDDACLLAEKCVARGLTACIALNGVHALMTFFSLCANLGQPFASDNCGPSENNSAIPEALEQMRRFLILCRAPVLDWNSIELQEQLSSSDELVYCPAVYGFSTYGEGDRQNKLAFAHFPGLEKSNSNAGSTIGGAGLGISTRVLDNPSRCEAAIEYASLAASPMVQSSVFSTHHGQPACLEVWRNDQIDLKFNRFFSATKATIESSWIRPRYHGYLRFQAIGGNLIEAHLRGDLSEKEFLLRLYELDADCRDNPNPNQKSLF